jgi:hypothetical protein
MNPTMVQSPEGASLAQMAAPSTTICLYEGDAENDGNGTPSWGSWFDPAIGDADSSSMASYGANDQWNVAIATHRHTSDGAVAYINPSETSSQRGIFRTGSNNYVMADCHVKFINWDRVSVADHPDTGKGTPVKNEDLGNQFAITFRID